SSLRTQGPIITGPRCSSVLGLPTELSYTILWLWVLACARKTAGRVASTTSAEIARRMPTHPPLSPTPPPLIPGEQQIGKAIVAKARHREHDRIAEQRRQPSLARRRAPDRDRDIGANDEPPRFIRRMQPPPHIIERCAIGGQRIRPRVDILERDAARA